MQSWTLELELGLFGIGIGIRTGTGTVSQSGVLNDWLTDCLTDTDVDEYQVNPFVTSKKASRWAASIACSWL